MAAADPGDETSGTGASLRVMLVDDHALVRSAVRQAIDSPDVELVGEAGSAEDAFALALAVRPDVMLLDIDLPGMNGIQMLEELGPRLPDTKIVMLTVSVADEWGVSVSGPLAAGVPLGDDNIATAITTNEPTNSALKASKIPENVRRNASAGSLPQRGRGSTSGTAMMNAPITSAVKTASNGTTMA